MTLQIALYALALFGAATVVLTPDPKRAIFAFAFYGVALAALFLALQAPDVALSEVAVGAAAVPFVTLVALARMERE